MEKVNSIIATTFKISIETASENHTMKEIRTWDSLKHMELIVSIESEFGIEISGDDIAEMISLDAIRQTVAKYLKEKS
jgi:acyl carrier protein